MSNSYKFENSVGLENCGQSCYMNSALQMLYSINEYRDFILNNNLNNNLNNSSTVSIIKKIFKLIQTNKGSSIRIKRDILQPIYKILYKQIFKENNTFGSQQDSEQILSFIIGQTSDLYILSIFSFQLIKDTYCRKNNVNNNLQQMFETTHILLLAVTKNYTNAIKNSLTELIKYFEIDEKLNVKLNRCGNSNTHTKLTIKIPEENKYLFIQLKRLFVDFYFDKDINIEQQLYINNNIYILIGVILRKGSQKSGHYIYATFKNNKIHKVYDDESVYNNLKYGFELNKHSYILLYKKFEKKVNILAKVNENNKIRATNEKVKQIDTSILQLLEEKKKLLEYQNKVLLKHSSNILEKEQHIKKELIQNKRYIKTWENKLQEYIENKKQINNNYKISLQLASNNFNQDSKVNTSLSFNENMNGNKTNLSERNVDTIINLQQKELNKYAVKKKQINNNYQLAQQLQKEYNEPNKQHNNNYYIDPTMQQEYNNEQLALKLQQEYNNEQLSNKII